MSLILVLTLQLLHQPSAIAALPPPAKLAPMPKPTAKLYRAIAGLWAGNKLLYCSPDRAIAETLREIRQLHEIKVASYEPRRSEIVVTTKDGAHGAIDLENLPKEADHPNCLRN